MHRRTSIPLIVIVCLVFLTQIPISAQTDIAAIVAGMSLEQRVGQLFVVRAWGTNANSAFREVIDIIHPGGVVFLPENLGTPAQITEMTNGLQLMSKLSTGVPLLIMVDQEGGTVQRLRDGFTRLPDPLFLGAIADDAVLQTYGRMVGTEMAAVGINMNLAPVVDLATTPNNPVTIDRMMGDDPVRVAAAASGFIAGMKAAGVVGVLKHFPGHGDVTDTHVNSGLLPYDMARLESVEIVPFLDADAPAIMMGHITAPLFDPSGAPATLSPTMVGYLRDAGFDGVIMTDAMDMGAIVNHYSATDAGVRAVKAGIDMVLLGAHVDNAEQIAVYGAVLNAVRSGEIPEAQINASVERILRLKQEYGVLDWQELDPAGAAGRIAAADSAGAFTEVYNAAITVAQDTASLLPLQGSVGVLYPSVYPDIEAVCSKYATDAGVSIEAMRYNFTPLNWEYGQAAALSNRVEKVVIFTENADQIPQQAQLAGVLPPERTVVVALGSPYDLRTVPNVSTYVLGYDAVPYAMDSACAVLFGARAASGVLAVDLVR